MRDGEVEVELLRVDGAVAAEPIVAALRASGIEARLVPHAASAVFGMTLEGLGEVAVVVLEGDAEAARELLAAAGRGELAVGEGELTADS